MVDYNTWSAVQISFNIPQIVELIWKLSLAVGVGLLIGRERKKRDKSGGSRTMSLICLSATILAVLSMELHQKYSFDFVRLIAYFLPAIGFMGAGLIQKNKDVIDGLTTSATLLTLLPVGFLIGLGYYIYAYIVAFFIWIILESKYVRRKHGKKRIRKANS